MRTEALQIALALMAGAGSAGCRRSSGPAHEEAAPAAGPPIALADPGKQVVLTDLRRDLSAARTAIASQKSPVYALDRLQLAARELEGEKDPGLGALISEAETIYGLQGPVAWADAKLKEAESDAAARPAACTAARDMLNRVSPKFVERSEVQDVVARVKGQCPKVRERSGVRSAGSSHGGGGSWSSSSSSQSANQAAQRDECRRRCDDASWRCRSSCTYCYSCTTDRTQEACTQSCNICKQGCEQNEQFCKTSCG
jgi:hypothetical protein